MQEGGTRLSGLYIELKDIINAAGGDWILEAEREGDDNEAFLVACFALKLILKEQPIPRVVKFLRGVADSLEPSMIHRPPQSTEAAARKRGSQKLARLNREKVLQVR